MERKRIINLRKRQGDIRTEVKEWERGRRRRIKKEEEEMEKEEEKDNHSHLEDVL